MQSACSRPSCLLKCAAALTRSLRRAEVLLCPDKRAPHENKELTKLAYGAKVDAWACGVLAYELLVGCPPFGMSTREGSVKAILYQTPKVPQWVPAAAADFILGALTKKASRRPAVTQLLAHSWIVTHACASTLLRSCCLHWVFSAVGQLHVAWMVHGVWQCLRSCKQAR